MLLSLTMLASAVWINETPVKSKPLIGEPSQLYSNQAGDDLEAYYTEAILSSKKSILLMIFALTDEKVIYALRQKSEEGIPITVICDAKACPNIVRKLGPNVHIVRRLGKGLMHLKILVIDGQECWIGTANLTAESLKMHGNLVVAITDSTLATDILKKAETLQEYDRGNDIEHTEYSLGGQQIELSFLPDDKEASLRIKKLIRSAQKTIRVAMYTWTRYDLAKEIIAAHQRGVEVEIVLDRGSSKGASAKVAAMFENAGIPISFSAGQALLHYKFMIVDDNILEVGSANWTKAAFTINDDCFLIIKDLSDEQKEHLLTLWNAVKSNVVQ